MPPNLIVELGPIVGEGPKQLESTYQLRLRVVVLYDPRVCKARTSLGVQLARLYYRQAPGPYVSCPILSRH